MSDRHGLSEIILTPECRERKKPWAIWDKCARLGTQGVKHQLFLSLQGWRQGQYPGQPAVSDGAVCKQPGGPGGREDVRLSRTKEES